MNLQPTLLGELITLRPLLATDFDALYVAASDPLIWEQHPCSDRHEKPVFEKLFNERLAGKGALVIIDNKDKNIIGFSGYYDFNSETSRVAIGYTFITRKYWGGTYNRELKKLMLAHAFKFVKNVEFHIGTTNTRSKKAIEKIGATLEKIVEKNCIYSLSQEFFIKNFAKYLV